MTIIRSTGVRTVDRRSLRWDVMASGEDLDDEEIDVITAYGGGRQETHG